MCDRYEFEKTFPVPGGIEWIDEHQGYRITSDDDYWFDHEGQTHFRGFIGQWLGWQAASAQSPNLSRIAQKKLDQMGATVHGVLVKNEAGAWAAVSDSGRVMWLDGFEGQACRSGETEQSGG